MRKTEPATLFARLLLACAFTAMPAGVGGAEEAAGPGAIFQAGELHEAIGEGHDQGRVKLAGIVARPHFYGLGALEGLAGEITILNSEAIVTGVAPGGRAEPLGRSSAQATMLAGRSVTEWMAVDMAEEVPPGRFDGTVGAAAAAGGIDLSEPFVFLVEGEFEDVRLHVINGACPIRARMRGVAIEAGSEPFEMESKRMNGTIVGIYAANSVGNLTHPATSTHAHLIYVDGKTGERVTGHIERVGLARGAVLKLPDPGERGAAVAAGVPAAGSSASITQGGEKAMQVYYLEIVTDHVDAVCAAYAAAGGAEFGKPDAGLGGARTAEMPGGGLVGVRAPMHETEDPVVRPYWLVDDIEAAVAAAVEAGAVVAHPPLEIPGHGTFAIYIQGGVQHGLWQR